MFSGFTSPGPNPFSWISYIFGHFFGLDISNKLFPQAGLTTQTLTMVGHIPAPPPLLWENFA